MIADGDYMTSRERGAILVATKTSGNMGRSPQKTHGFRATETAVPWCP